MTQPPVPPMPVQMLDYGTPPPAGRPGLLTTVGILSIVFSVFYGLSAVGTVMTTFMYYSMSQTMTAFSAPPPSIPTGVPATVVAPVAIPRPAPGDEMAEADQETLLAALDQTRGLDPADQAAVGTLLQQIGWKVAGHPPGGAATLESLERLISQSGATFDGGTFYGLPGGRLEVADGSAMFTATTDGTVTTTGAAATATTLPAVAPPALAMPISINFNISTGALTLSLIDAALRFGLAVWLLVAGIKVLSNSPGGRRWHLRWAWVKLPLLLLSAAAAWWITSSMFNGIFSSPATFSSGPPMPGFGSYIALMTVIFYAVIAAVYPVTVLILMNLNTARVFYTTDGPVK